MERKGLVVRKEKLKDQGKDEELKETTASERMAMVWEITKDVWAFIGEKSAESRLSRHVVAIQRGRS